MTPTFVPSDDFHQKAYRALTNMYSRCYNPNHNRSHRYKGKGITICDRWKGCTEYHYNNFLEDMGLPPTLNHSIDRKNNDLDYTKDNCKWSTDKEQANNRELRQDTEAIYYSKIYNGSWEVYYRHGKTKQHLFLCKLEFQAKVVAQQFARNRGINYVKH